MCVHVTCLELYEYPWSTGEMHLSELPNELTKDQETRGLCEGGDEGDDGTGRDPESLIIQRPTVFILQMRLKLDLNSP